MRRFLITYWSLPLSIVVWTSCVIRAAILEQPINAGVALAALICVCALTRHTWRHYMLNAQLPTVSTAPQIQAAPVQRDSDGYWTHPAHPEFEEGQDVEAAAWFNAQQLEHQIAYLESEDGDHPAYEAYWSDGDPNISAWEPPRPEGEGWFILSIHDTEDWGPVCVWVRRAEYHRAHASN